MWNKIIVSLLITTSLLTAGFDSKAQYEQKFTLQAAGGYIQALQPEFFSDAFNNGFSFDAGAQYNFNRSLSLVVLAKYSTFFAEELMFGDVEYNLIGISLCPKYKLLSSGRINPYLLGGVSLNYYTFKIPGFDVPWRVDLGFSGGLGFDFRLNDNLGLFLQGGINGVNNSDGDMFIAFYTQLGVNISLIKSKSL